MSSDAPRSTESPTDPVNDAAPPPSPAEPAGEDPTIAGAPTESTNETARSTQSPSVEQPSRDVDSTWRLRGPGQWQWESEAERAERAERHEALVQDVVKRSEAEELQEKLRELQRLYVVEKRLRRRLRAIRRTRVALTTTIVLCILFLVFWGPIVYILMKWHLMWGLDLEMPVVLLARLILAAGYAFASLGIIASGFWLLRSGRQHSVVETNNEIDEIVAQRNSILATSHAKTADYIQKTKLDVAGYQDLARRLRWTNNILQIVIILGSLLAATFAGAGGNNPTARWAAVVSGVFASFAASMISFFKFKERSFSLDQAGTSIDTELNSYDLSGGRYRRLAEKEREPELVEAIERVRGELRQREAALGTESTK